MKFVFSILLMVGLLILDQLSKYYFGFVENTGAFFGLLPGYKWFFIVFSLVVLGVFIWYYPKGRNRWGFNLIIVGTLGNLIDRIFFDYVRDFIDIKIWPVFNFADVYITIGVILIIYLSFKK